MTKNIKHNHVELIIKQTPTTFRGKKDKYMAIKKEMSPHIKQNLKVIKKVLKYKESQEKRRGQKKGKIDKKNLYKVGSGNKRVFYKQKKTDSDMSILLLLDASGSMMGRREIQAHKAAITFREILKDLKIPHAIWDFTTSDKKVISTEYINFNNWDKIDDSSLNNFYAGGENRDGYNLRLAINEIKKRGESKKLIIVISDGQPSHYFDRYYDLVGIKDLKKAVNEAKKQNVDVLGLSIGDEHNYMDKIYKNHICINNINELPRKLSKILRKIILN
ncbi:MAG: cobaltochelatase CobT-related protein [archaeon]